LLFDISGWQRVLDKWLILQGSGATSTSTLVWSKVADNALFRLGCLLSADWQGEQQQRIYRGFPLDS